MPIRTPPIKLAVVHNGIIENFRELREEIEAKGVQVRKPRPTPKWSRIWSRMRSKQARSPVEAVESVVATAARRIRARVSVCRRGRSADRRAQGLAAGGRLWRGRDVSRLGRHRAAHRSPTRSAISKTATAPSAHAAKRRDPRCRRRSRPAPHPHNRRKRPACSSTRAIIAISWRRKFTSSRKSSAHTLAHYLDMTAERGSGANELPFDFRALERISIVACGTAYYAGMVAQLLVRELRQAAGGRRYRLRIPLPRRAARCRARWRSSISQSGETADTLASLRYAQAAQASTYSPSSMCRKLDDRAGERRRHADPCRAGNRRRFDQGIHLSAGRAGCACRCRGPRARRADARARRSDCAHALIEVPRHW